MSCPKQEPYGHLASVPQHSPEQPGVVVLGLGWAPAPFLLGQVFSLVFILRAQECQQRVLSRRETSMNLERFVSKEKERRQGQGCLWKAAEMKKEWIDVRAI